jgi:hypothetical protein
MSNVIQNHLYVTGPVALVDDVTKRATGIRWRGRQGEPGTAERNDVEVVSETAESKMVRISFEVASDAPWDWFRAQVEQYHGQGVRFFLSWYDADNIHIDRETDRLYYSRFGEYYTELIPHRCGDREDFTTVFTSPEMGARFTDGPITLIFNKMIEMGDGANETLVDGKVVSVPATDEEIEYWAKIAAAREIATRAKTPPPEAAPAESPLRETEQ